MVFPILFNSKAALLQWKPRDAALNFDIPKFAALRYHVVFLAIARLSYIISYIIETWQIHVTLLLFWTVTAYRVLLRFVAIWNASHRPMSSVCVLQREVIALNCQIVCCFTVSIFWKKREKNYNVIVMCRTNYYSLFLCSALGDIFTSAQRESSSSDVDRTTQAIADTQMCSQMVCL